jgi:hypothetical protein
MAMVAVGYTAYYAANPHRIWGAFAALVVSCILLVMGALKGEWR